MSVLLGACSDESALTVKPLYRIQAGLSVGQVAFAALVAAVPPAEGESSGELGYPGRFGVILASTIVTDAFVALVALCFEHCFDDD